ncbi:MAG: LamG-like jellyroll fold domain-containing protein, partial [Planctomycetota bacterium]
RRGSLRLTTGEGDWLNGNAADSGFERRVLPSLDEVAASAAAAEDAAYADWGRWSRDLTADERLVAFYSGDDERDTDRAFVNMAGASSRASDGAIIGLADFPDGRFGAVSKAVALNRPGSRVRVHVDGEFRAYTFACWVRIDSLPNRYNALFMGDGYDNGEPHWQIHEDGRLMLSVMVDTSDRPTRIDAGGNTVVTDNGRHKVYFSPPVWDMSMSGRWLHIAATYDPATREVVHYVDGEAVSRHAIEDKFYIESLQIGPAEIGSWGQPFRDSPWFAVRTLHGAVDDLMVFDAAVDADEMRRLYKAGRPPGHLGQ